MKRRTIQTIIKSSLLLIAIAAVLSVAIVFVFPEPAHSPHAEPQSTGANGLHQVEQNPPLTSATSLSPTSTSAKSSPESTETKLFATSPATTGFTSETYAISEHIITTQVQTSTATSTTTPATTMKTTSSDTETPKTTPLATNTEPPTYFGGFENSQQIILAVVENESTTVARFYFYEKEDTEWSLTFSADGRVGKAGISPISSRVQSSNKTPAGVMQIIGAFGILDDPGAKFDYRKVSGDMYWDLNSGSPNYNLLVYENPGGMYERLADYTNTYKYALITDYNLTQQEGKGGAIFVHCNGLGATQGCVSLPLEEMKQLVISVDPLKLPVLIVTLSKDVIAYVGDMPK